MNEKTMIKLVDEILYSSEEMTKLTMWWVSENIKCVEKEYKKRLRQVENRLNRLEKRGGF